MAQVIASNISFQVANYWFVKDSKTVQHRIKIDKADKRPWY